MRQIVHWTAVVVAMVVGIGVTAAPVAAQAGWRVMPIRSQAEWDAGMVGGEGEQHPTGIARCVSRPDRLYLAHDCGQAWRSDDNGLTWAKLLCKGMWVANSQGIEADPVDANTVVAVVDAASNYLAEDYEGVYRSTDGGENWSLVLRTQGIVQRFYQHCIVWDPASIGPERASRWYVAIPTNGLYRSEDGGVTWTLAVSLASVENVYGIWAHGSDGQTLYMASSRGLEKSTDRGASWTALGNLPSGTVTSVAIHPQNAETIYAVVRGTGLYRSTNGGATFSLVRSFDAVRVFLSPSNPSRIFLIGLNTNSLVSSNGGASWTTVSVTPAPGLGREWKTKLLGEFCAVSPDPRDANAAVAYSNACLWRTSDGGLHWADSSTLYTGHAWGWWADGVGFDVADPNRFVLFCCDISMDATTTGGDWFTRYRVPWEWYQQGLISWPGMYAGDIQPIPGSQVIVGSGGMYFDTKLVRSANGGATWTIVDNDSENHLFVAFHPQEPNLVFSGYKRSTDAGVTWQSIPYLESRNASIFGMSRSNPDTIYALTRPRDDILRSDDRGETWRVYATTSWTFNRLDSKPTFAVDPGNPDRVYTVDRYGDLAVFDGTTWRSLGVLALAGGDFVHNFVRMVAVDPRHPEILYVEMQAAGLPSVFRSVNGGETWEDITLNLPRVGNGGIVVHPLTGDLMHGSCFGTWVYPPPYASPNALYWRLGAGFAVTGWQVLANHEQAGILATEVSDGWTEPRAAGLRTLRIAFTRAADPATIVPGIVTITGAVGGDKTSMIESLSLDESQQVLTVTMSVPLPDGDTYTVAVTPQLKDAFGMSIEGDADVTLKVLAGDVDGSGSVTAADMLAVRAAAGSDVESATARLDVDGSGAVTAADMAAIRPFLGHAMPGE